MTTATESKAIADFLKAAGIKYGIGVFVMENGKLTAIDTCPSMVEKTGMVEILHRGVQVELTAMHLDRLKEEDDAAQRSRTNGSPVSSQE